MSARSARVKGRSAFTASRLRRDKRRLQLADEILSGPRVVVENGRHMPGPIDHGRAQVVRDGAVLFADDIDAEARRESIDVLLRGGREAPDRRIGAQLPGV